jgi:hypothetical protein
MSTPAKVIHDLPALTYGGLSARCDDIETSWSHMLAPRDYYGVDAEAHEWTKRESFKVGCKLYFLNTEDPNAYPKNWSKWRQALLRGDARQLKHPEVGTFYARPADVSYTITSKSTAGVVVSVSFIESINSADEPSKLTSNGAGAMTQAAADADYAMGALGLSYPDGMPSPTFEEFVGAIASLGFTIETQTAGKLAQLHGLTDAVYDAVQSLAKAQAFADGIVKDALAGAPLRWLLEHSLNSMRVLATSALEQLSRGARETLKYRVDRPTSLAAISFELGADIVDIITLNTSLLGAPLVLPGADVLYYAGV